MRALIAVSNKSQIVEFSRELSKYNCEIIATKGTASHLASDNILSKTLDEITGNPDLLGGRVKTFYPEIFGGILYIRGDKNHEDDVVKFNLLPIDIVVCNFYPFTSMAYSSTASVENLQEYIDIGGPAIIRAAAKNFQHVLAVVDPLDYSSVLKQVVLSEGNLKGIPFRFRLNLARKAFQYTHNYDLSILNYYSELS